jgi:ribosome-binding factor A
VGRRIQEEISDMILRGLKDPRLDMVSITDVEVSGDLQAAKVYFCVFEKRGGRSKTAAEGFESALGFIRRELLKRLGLRKLPELTFHYDASFDRGDRIERLLKETHADDGAAEGDERTRDEGTMDERTEDAGMSDGGTRDDGTRNERTRDEGTGRDR